MRRVLSVTASWAVLMMMMAAVPAPAATKIVDRIIARVNSEIITQRMFEQEKEKLRTQLSSDYSGAELETQFREQSRNLLRDLIDQSLMVQKANDLDINVDTDVIKKLDDIRQQYNLSSLDDLQKEVEKQGIIWEDFKDQIKRQLLMREVIGREVGSRIVVSRDDARKYYEAHKDEFKSPGMVHLEEILVSAQKHKPEEAKKRAADALADLNAGQRFSETAKKYSDGPNADQGGDIGFVKMGSMAPEIADAVSKLEVNQTSGILDTKFGYLILKITERFSPGIPKFEEVEQRINEQLYNQKMQPDLRSYLRELRKESYIYLAPGYIDAGAERPSDALAAKGAQ
ncbi:MAG: peptidyl-prolyl cis-trans isomerase [Acidobacteriia bacterium]|nr:peptidyl-prolyl cis-trans isomerase [Terriglobia bacterium]